MSESDAQEKTFFSHVGHCVALWADVEEELFKICHAALGTSRNLAAIVYSHTLTIGSRLTLVDALLKSALPSGDPTLAGWTSILSSIGQHLSLRNVIAHKPAKWTFDIQVGDSGKLEFGDSWYEFQAAEFDRRRGRPVSDIRLDDLKRHRAAVEKIVRGLRLFHRGLPTKIRKARFRKHP